MDLPKQKAIDESYQKYVLDLLLIRFRILTPICIVAVLAFNFLDKIAYPEQADMFLGIRLITCAVALTAFLLTFSLRLKPYIEWFPDIICLTVAVAIVFMIHLTDKSSSGYYQGLNLIFLAMNFFNPFNVKHLSWLSILVIACFEWAVLSGSGPFNMVNFTHANFFMATTAVFVAISIKLYGDQHYQAYARQVQLKLSEEKLAALYSQADKLAKTDALTDINNRRYFFEMLEVKIQTYETAKTPFYLVIFDVDYFKEINDNYGHAFGDKILVSVVDVVKNNIRSNDFIGRYGGDEFIICLDMSNREALTNRLNKIANAVQNLNLMWTDKDVSVSISIGAARFNPGKNMTAERLMELADAELLNVKRTTRGQVSVGEE